MAKHESNAADDVSSGAVELDDATTAEEMGTSTANAPRHGFFVRLYTGTGAFDVVGKRKEAMERYSDELPPTLVVLFQELERFNTLIQRMSDSLANLRRALKGEIGMSSDLDELSLSLFNGFLPSKPSPL